MAARAPRFIAALVGFALACSPEDEPAPVESEEPRLYVSVVGGKVESSFPTQLRVFDLSDPDAPRSEVVLDAEDEGWVQHLHNGRSPGGRYGLYLYAHDFGGQGFDPWLFGLHLVDFERAPLGPTRYLGIPATQASAGWTADERLMWLLAYDAGETSLWTLALGDADPRPLARIPIDVPPPGYVNDCKFAPGGQWLYFVAGNEGQLFAVRFEDRQPVGIEEIQTLDDAALSMPLWLDAHGRGLATANDGSGARLVAFDLSMPIDPQAEDVVVADLPATAYAWSARETEDGQLWALQLRTEEDDGLWLAWVALDWTEDGIVADAPIGVDALLFLNGGADRLFAGDGLYFHGQKTSGPVGDHLMYAGVGEATSEQLWLANFDLSSYATNRGETLLLAHGNAGVLAFELGPDGPGPAQLVSLTDWTQWGLYDERFVQAFGEGLGNFVHVVDLGASPPTTWHLPGTAPLAAVPSPIDTRVFVLDDRRLWVDDLEAAGVRTQLRLPNTEPQIFDPASPPPLDELFGEYAVGHAVVHAPGVATYAPW